MAEDNGQGANLEPEQHSAGMLKDPQSRRRFLRAAAIGTAGVAGVAGAAGIAQACGAPKVLAHWISGDTKGSPPPPPPPSLDGFFEETGPGPCVTTYSFGPGTGKKNRYVTFYAKDLPTGHYTFDVTQKVAANAAGPIQAPGHGTAALQWEFKEDHQVHVVVRDANTEPACPGPWEDDKGHKEPHVVSVATFSSFSVTFDLSGTHDVAIYAHIIDLQNPLLGPTIFTGTLTGPVNKTATVTATKV